MALRYINIIIQATDHARKRWKQLNMEDNPEYVTGCRLFDALKKGAMPDKYGAIHVYIRDEVWAVVMPELWGGWSIVTFYLPGVRLGGDDQAGHVILNGGCQSTIEGD